jgi:hypothetical protein
MRHFATQSGKSKGQFYSMRTAKHTVDSVRPQVIGGWECVLLPMRPV